MVKEDRSVRIKNGIVNGSVNTGNINYEIKENRKDSKESKYDDSSEKSDSNQILSWFFNLLDGAQRTEYFLKFIGMLTALVSIGFGTWTYFKFDDVTTPQVPEIKKEIIIEE